MKVLAALLAVVICLSLSSAATLTTCNNCAECGGASEILVDAAVVASKAFSSCTTLTSVTFSDNVVSIGDRAFFKPTH